MNYECKITVLETKVVPELQEKYLADPKSGPCPCFKAGDTFLLKRTPEQDDFYRLMNGKFCGEAWDAISRYVYAALQGGSIMRKWTNDDRRIRFLSVCDREKGSQYCETLYHYLSSGRSLKETCAALFTHRNTILYRIHKMQDEYGVPLDDPSAHLELLLGVSLALFRTKGADFFLAQM